MSESALVPGAQGRQPKAYPAGPPPPSPIQKAAIILMAIGPELGGAILRDLAEPDLLRFARALSSLGKVQQPVLDAVIVDFLETLALGPGLSGGDDAARRLLGSVLDENEVTQLLGGNRGRPRSVWERLNETPLGPLATFIQAEHPQTAAIIVSELRPETAAAVLERLDRPFAQSIVVRLGRIPSLDANVAQAIQSAIDRDFLSVLQRNMTKRRPAEMIAGLMNNISSEARDGFLQHLEAQDSPLAQEVQRTMFTFEDIATRIAPRDVSSILRDVPDETLLKALKLGETQESATVGFILGNIPRRLAERYIEDVANMASVPRKEGEAAQIEITKLILDLGRRGTIRFIEKDG